MTEPSQSRKFAHHDAVNYRADLMHRLHLRWQAYADDWDECARNDWDGTRERRMILEYRMDELNHVMRDMMPWPEP